MSNLKKILSSFKVRESLNPKIWIKKDGQAVMNPKVREKLLEIANDFVEYLKVDIVVTDVIMTGSLANFNWSNFSDVDLHIVADFAQFPEEQLDLYKELFTLKKTLYNEKHDITIYSYDVELYVQNETEAHFSSGVYSVLFNEWSNKPKKENVKIDTDLIKTKSNQWMDIIDGIIENASDESLETAKSIIKKYKDKLKKYRTCGLEKEGEYSDENLVFKVLRRNGYIEKLHDFENKLIDKNYSLNEGNTNIGGPFNTDLENGPANHKSRGFGNWQSDNAWDIFEPPGTIVNAYTDGTVSRVRDTGKNSGKIFGTQVSVSGVKGFPDIFYTHLKNVRLKKGDKVSIGDVVGEVSEWVGHEKMTHVHIGLPYGRHIKELLKNSDKIFSGPQTTTIDSKPEDVSPSNSEVNTTTDTKDFAGKLENLYKSGKELKIQEKPIQYDESVETLQTALQILGFSLPKWGVDGKFGAETEEAVKKFQSSINSEETGVADKNLITKIILATSESVSKDSSALKDVQKTKTETLPDEPTKSSDKPQNASSTTDDEYVIIKSNGYKGSNVHVLFGGYHTNPGYSRNGANLGAMKKYIPHLEPYSNNAIIVITHHMNTLANVKKYVKEKFGANVTSIAGFSQGGREAWEHADDSSLRLVGLIDPSTYKTGLSLGSNTYLYCDPKNWGTSGFVGQTRKRLEWYCDHKSEYGDKVICFSQGGTHMNFKILISFYQRFGGRL